MLVLAIVSLGLMWIVFSKYAAPPLIKSAYRGESLSVFNGMISGQASHPLTEYLSDWDRLRWRVLLDFSLVGLLVVLVIGQEFREALWGPEAAPPKNSLASSYPNYLCIVLAISTTYLLCFSLAGATRLPLRIFFFDMGDLRVYFNSSAWIMGKGRLYLDVRSEYPILANLIFGCVRFLSSKIRLLSSDFDNFSLMWITCASVAFAYLLTVLQKRNVVWGSWLLLLLLAPATIYFSLLRYDIYPALFSFWGLDFLRKRKWNLAAFLIGVCIALKGYAVFVIPAFFVFCWYQIGPRLAFVAVVVMLLPLLVSNFAVFVWGGKEALLAPYKLQIFRRFNGESSFDSLFFLCSWLGISQARIAALSSWILKNHIPKIIQSATALGACLFRPACFESFMDAALLSVLGFMTFSPFYSPQWVLWLIPFLLLTRDRVLLLLGIFLAWSTYVYFPTFHGPLGSDLIRFSHPTLFAVSVLVITSTRFFMIARLIRKLGTKETLHAPPPEECFEG